MSEPPEGDNVVLGKGGTFKVPEGGFQGWTMLPERPGPWLPGFKHGRNEACLYAAPRSSEVARLNGLDQPDYEAAWNSQADEFNQWCDLGDDEKADWIAGKIAESPSFKAKPPAVHGEGESLVQRWRRKAATIDSELSRENTTLFLGSGEKDRYEQAAVTFRMCADELEKESADKDALIRGLVEALRFYADTSKYPVPKTGGLGELYFDCGEIAKSALRQAEQGGGA